jgi:hypothetical protein
MDQYPRPERMNYSMKNVVSTAPRFFQKNKNFSMSKEISCYRILFGRSIRRKVRLGPGANVRKLFGP